MKAFCFSVLFMLQIGFINAQQTNPKLYNPEANAKKQLNDAVVLADSLGKHVFVQVGGNWCKWCLRFNKFCNDSLEVDTLLHNNYVVVHLNYSKENENLDVLETLGYPQRFGFPVIVILDGKGNRIHTQDSALLEKDGSYDKEKVVTFMSYWTPRALNPSNYQK
jgi:thioredoxin-related protein